MSILIVDDAEDARLLTAAMLRREGYKDIVLAESAADALVKLGIEGTSSGTVEPDLILMDVFMPGVNGIAACRRIKAHAQYRDVPIVMLTGSSEADDLQQAFAAGAVDYISKPVHRVELIARVRSLLQLKYEMDQRKEREKELVEIARQLTEANAALQRMTAIDGLTGIFNRRYFDEHMEQEWKRAERDASTISLIMTDIDFFKAYNDTYGHQGGDDCLKRVAAALQGVLKRPADFVARYGGEEFVAVMPDTDREGALQIAEEFRARVEALGIAHAGSKAADHVTISLGVASIIPGRDQGSETLLAAADAALYVAKRGGRNRVNAAESRSGEKTP